MQLTNPSTNQPSNQQTDKLSQPAPLCRDVAAVRSSEVMETTQLFKTTTGWESKLTPVLIYSEEELCKSASSDLIVFQWQGKS